MKLKYIISTIIMLLMAVHSFAQPYIFKHLGVQDGLSNNYVRDIVQDGQGFIWVATESGLSRFDGAKFTNFEENTSGLISNALNCLLYDEEHNTLWIGSKEGISWLNCETLDFENYVNNEGAIVENIVHFSPAADGGIWLTNHHGGITYYNKKQKQFTTFPNEVTEAHYSHWCAFDDGKGQLYLGHAQMGLSIIDLKTKTVKNYRHDPQNPGSLPGNSVYTIYVDHLNNTWIGTNQGLALFNPNTEEFLTFKHIPGNPTSLIADHIYSLKEMNNGLLWIATDIGGISILDLKNISFMNPRDVQFINITPQSDNTGISSTNTRSLLQDSFGNIWIGNYSSGLDFISHTPPPFSTLPYTNQGTTPKSKPVWGICSDTQNRVWLGCENEIAVFKDNKLIKSIPITDYISRPYAQVFAITCDRQGLFWLGIYDDGLLTYHESTNRFERIKLDIDNMDIITFFEDTDGRVWIGAEYGLYSGFRSKVRKEEKIISQLRDRSVYAILRDHQGKLWVGTYGGGVSVFDKDDNLIINITTETGFSSNSVSHLFLDSKGGVWAATRNGIGYFSDTNNPAQYELYGYKQGLADMHVRAIHEDQSGNIWLSTNDGISLWDKENNEFDNYNFRYGIPIGNFIEGSACSTSDGTIYFGSLNGVCYFDPNELTIAHPVSPVQIIECTGFNKQIESRNEEYFIPLSGGKISLPHNHSSFRISFSVPDYSQNQQVEYAYQMEGIDKAWYNTQGENQVTFRNLSPGEYQFRVKAKLKNHDWDEMQIAALAVRVHPPVWLTWYAKLFYLIILLLIIYFLMRFYKNRLNLKTSLELERKENQSKQELNDERLRFYTNITHELRTPLTLILGPLEDLVHDPKMAPEYKNKINIIHNSAIRLLNLINQILEFRKTETQNKKLTVGKSDLAALVREIGLRYKELNQNTKVKFNIRIETDDTELYFDTDILTTILNNLLSNALKYTPEGEINLILRSVVSENKHFTEIEVNDTGYGIETNALPYIFDRYYQARGKHQASGTGIGLALVKSVAELHEGILQVESTQAKGTSFRFRLLTTNTYPNALHTETKFREEIHPELPSGYLQTDENETRPVVLVAEDNTEIREYIANSLKPNHIVMAASNGKEGLELAQKTIPDVIISDIMMPEMDGLEFCRIIKNDIRTSHIPVILLTAKDSMQDKEEGYESGADSYLTKPFSARLLLSRIQNILESRRKLADQIISHPREIPHKPITGSTQNTALLSPMDEEFLAKITSLIEDNLNMEKMDITFLRKKVNMSHSTFYRKIKGLTGISANEFIRKIKMKNARRLLLSGTCNISETSYRIGFSDVSYFRQCFKEEYGMTPSECLKKERDDL